MSRDPSLRASSLNTPSPKDAQVVGGVSPLPWSFEPVLSFGEQIIIAADGEEIALFHVSDGADEPTTINALANTRLAVKAVNSHEANEAKIAAAVKALEEIEAICTESAGDCRRRMGTRVGNALVTARTTLSSLKEGK